MRPIDADNLALLLKKKNYPYEVSYEWRKIKGFSFSENAQLIARVSVSPKHVDEIDQILLEQSIFHFIDAKPNTYTALPLFQHHMSNLPQFFEFDSSDYFADDEHSSSDYMQQEMAEPLNLPLKRRRAPGKDAYKALFTPSLLPR